MPRLPKNDFEIEEKAWRKFGRDLKRFDTRFSQRILGNGMKRVKNLSTHRFINKQDALGRGFAKNAPFTLMMKKASGNFSRFNRTVDVGLLAENVKSAEHPDARRFASSTLKSRMSDVTDVSELGSMETVGEHSGKLRREFYNRRSIRFYRGGAVYGENFVNNLRSKDGRPYALYFSEGWNQSFTEKQAWWFYFQMTGGELRPGAEKAVATLMAGVHSSPARRINQLSQRDCDLVAKDIFDSVITYIRSLPGAKMASGAG